MTIEENYVFPVYINEETLNKIIIYCKSFEKEIFGYIIGHILNWDKQTYVKIEDLIFILGAIHSDDYSTGQIELSAGKYNKKVIRLNKKRKIDNLRVLGWWHSHPGFGCFLSPTDLKTQEYFFPESYQVALVVDPVRDELEFFTLKNNSENGYKKLSYAVTSSS